MDKKYIEPEHPGTLFFEDFLEPLDMNYSEFARHIGVSRSTVREVCQGKRDFTLETSALFGKAFGLAEDFLYRWQQGYNISMHKYRMLTGQCNGFLEKLEHVTVLQKPEEAMESTEDL